MIKEGRLLRQRKRFRQLAGDVSREVSWRLGGASFYRRHGEALARGYRWCFVVGCNNSGTSLLHSILGRTGQVSTFELEGQRYTRTLQRAARKGHERVWTEFLDELRLTESDAIDCRPRLLHDWLRELEPPLEHVIVEKTTANAVRMRWLQKAFPDSVFVAMVRNGYAVCEGIYRKGERDMRRAARHWNLANRIMVDDGGCLERFTLLSYEELVQQPEATAERLGALLGIDAGNVRNAMAGEFSFATVKGKGNQGMENLNAAGIARLAPGDFDVINAEASEMLSRLGYGVMEAPVSRRAGAG